MDIRLQTSKGKIKIIAILFVTAALSAVILYLLYLSGAFLPRWIYWEEREDTMNGGEAYVKLDGKRVEVYITQNTLIWSTDKSIKAQSFYVCDLDHNGFDELMILCWKRGRYGDSKPFWIERDEKAFVQHIYIYELRNGKMSPKWMTSELGRVVREWEIINGRYILLRDLDGEETLWQWESYGLKEAD